MTVIQTDISSWVEFNQECGACKSASLAVHVKISYSGKLTELTCVYSTVLMSSTLLSGETSLTSEYLTRIQSQQPKFGDPSEEEQWLLICIRMKRKIKGSGIPIFESSFVSAFVLQRLCRRPGYNSKAGVW